MQRTIGTKSDRCRKETDMMRMCMHMCMCMPISMPVRMCRSMQKIIICRHLMNIKFRC